MGLFARLLTAARSPADGGANKATLAAQRAGRLLQEGMSLEQRGRPREALQHYEAAIELSPELARAHFNRGTILLDLGDWQPALEAFTKTLEYKPDSATAHFNMGNAYTRLGRHESALAAYQAALRLKPDFADANVAQGAAQEELGQLDAAAESYRNVLQIKPDYAEVHYNLGITLKGLGRLDEALASFHQALDIKPDFVDAYDCLLFTHNYLNDQPASLMLSQARRYGEMVTRLARPFTTWPNLRAPDRPLRVGLLSGDLRNHPVGYFADGVLTALTSNPAQLTLFAYPTRICDDVTSERIKARCTGWQSVVGLCDQHVAQRIRDDEIDILIDLSGHTAHNRLAVFAWKPAPVQVSWLGYFATTGLAAIDYFIADPWTLPTSEEESFTEQIWRLPETRLCFTPPDADVPVSPLPALSNRFVTFGCFNNLSKMNDAVVTLWAIILTAVPGSRLFLKAGQLAVTSMRQQITERFAAHGIEAGRLILEDYAPRAHYLAAYQRVDLALDPFPYPGGTTTIEALWMGVPVLTLAGERFLSRQGVGLLMNAGLPDWVATDADDYVARAIHHTSDLHSLAALRGGLRQQVLASPICNAPRFAAHFEAALRSMWQQWCAQPANAQLRIEKASDGVI